MDIADSIADLQETDPIQLVIQIEKRLRPDFDNSSYPDFDLAYKYFSAVKRACHKLGVEFNVPDPKGRGGGEAKTLVELTRLEIELKQIDILAERVRAAETVALDENWRGRIHSYIANIKPIVERADISVGLRDSIMQRINDLAAEIDRSRTRVKVAGDLLIELCAIAGSAATELRPVVTIAEKIVGAFMRLHSYSVPPAALPAPDNYGLNAPPETPPPIAEERDA